jgi:type IV secretory pathway TraG/TraD family ATPase VirD4
MFKKKNRKIEPLWVKKGYLECTTLSHKWQLSDKLFKFSLFSKAFSLDQAFRGIKIYGANGSGKTSGFARVIATSYLDHGFGGLVMCAKGDNDELNNWESMTRVMERSRSLIHFGPKNKEKIKDKQYCFNILEFIRTLTDNKNESQANLVAVLKMISNNLQSGKLSQSDSFWDGVTDQYLTHLLTLTFSFFPMEAITFEKLNEVFKSIQTNPKEINFMIKTELTTEVQNAVEFFVTDFLAINEKTRSIIVAAVSSLLFKFNSGLLRDLFGGEGNIDPRWTFGGAVIVINVPTHEYQEIGKTANLIWKYAFQKACTTRKSIRGFQRPVFLWADEAQEFIHPDDAKFQAVARSSRCATVYITQNIAGLRLTLGSGAMAQDAIESIESNLLTTIFHQNVHAETNKFASNSIGTKKVKVTSRTSKGIWSKEVSESTVEKIEPIFSPETFTDLKAGGHTDKNIVEAIVYVPGSKRFFDFLSFRFCDWCKVRVRQGEYKHFRVAAVDKYDVEAN